MGCVTQPMQVKLFLAVLYDPSLDIDALLLPFDKQFGKRLYYHGPVSFSWTSYYEKEMGTALQKLYCSYMVGIDRETLPAIKVMANKREAEYAVSGGGRRVNIDPGYVARDKVVLATTKDFYHRLYLANGIYGEVTLHYRKGRFRYFSWTYPDFKDVAVIEFLERIRLSLVKEICRDRSDT